MAGPLEVLVANLGPFILSTAAYTTQDICIIKNLAASLPTTVLLRRLSGIRNRMGVMISNQAIGGYCRPNWGHSP